jgi:hypothetical protein
MDAFKQVGAYLPWLVLVASESRLEAGLGGLQGGADHMRAEALGRPGPQVYYIRPVSILQCRTVVG